MFSRNDFSIWSVLKNCIGKELSKITMPVIFNEPLSFLQRMTEYMEYAKLLRIASEQEDPVDRMKYVAGEIIISGAQILRTRILIRNFLLQDSLFQLWPQIGSDSENHLIRYLVRHTNCRDLNFGFCVNRYFITSDVYCFVRVNNLNLIG